MRPLKTLSLAVVGLLLVLAAVVAFLTRDVAITSWSMIWNSITGSPGPRAEAGVVIQQLQVPPGWQLSVYADAVPEARTLRPTLAGDLLVSQPRLGQITLKWLYLLL